MGLIKIDEAQLAQLLRDQRDFKQLQVEYIELCQASDRNTAKMTCVARANRNLIEQLEQANIDLLKGCPKQIFFLVKLIKQLLSIFVICVATTT